MPTYGLHIPDDWEYKKVFDAALAAYKGKPSPFIRYAVEASLRKDSVAPDALAATVLVDLARRLCGELDARALDRHLCHPVGAFYGAGLAASKAARNSSSVGSVAGGSASRP